LIPKKQKLPKVVNCLDLEEFSDVLYDSDKDVKKAKVKKGGK